jgi:rSAM/selenodomain-associated transferase 1
MAMAAGLIALASDIDLEGLQTGAAQYKRMFGELLVEPVHRRETLADWLTLSTLILPTRVVAKEQLIVFVKAPRPGTVKTRIARTAGAARACGIYRQLVEAVLGNLASLRCVELRFSPDDALEEIKSWQRGDWDAVPQGSGDLGARLVRTFEIAFANGAERVAIVGSDCPEVQKADVQVAWKELKSHDVVLGPAVDGGYWLIGLRAPQPELFRDIAWSSDQVLAKTLTRAKSLGLRIQLLRILSDIDTEADWNAYVRQRDSS